MRRLIILALLLGGGCGTPSFLITPVQNANRLQEMVIEGSGSGSAKIAVIEVEGMLANVRSPGLLQPTENPVSLFVQQLDAAARDNNVAAVVLRINSPGGTVTSADTLYQTILRFREKTHKPVIAATQEVAASGGYYVACAADRIIAHPTSVIGSIGTLFYTFDVEGTLGKLGVRTQAIKSAPFKDMGSPLRQLSPLERRIFQEMVDEYYARFVAVVRQRRGLEGEALTRVTDGRVFSGQNAVELKLADATGLLDDAIDVARAAAKAPHAKVILYKRPYGYGGSIYAANPTQPPQANVIQLPTARDLMPTGFYYLWNPG